MTQDQLLKVADGDDNVAESLVGMYAIPQNLASRIVAMAKPYARISTVLVDRAFVNLVRAHKPPKGTVTPETIKMLGDLLDHVLSLALLDQENSQKDNAAYVNNGLVVLGSSMDQFPQGLNYWRVIPAMRMLLPRLIEIQLNCDEAAE